MNDDELGRRLNEAFDARARAHVPEHRQPPPMRLPDHLSPYRTRHPRRSRAHWLAPLAAVAAVLVAVAIVVGVSSDSPRHAAIHGAPPGPVTATGPTAPSASHSARPATGKPVRVSSAVLGDGSRVGVGMPIIVLLSRPIKDAHAFAAATKVTVDGRAVSGGWYFENKFDDSRHPIEADYRLPSYWPGHAKIHLALPVKGLSAGKGLVFSNNLSLDFATGAANVLTVDNATHKLTVMSDGKHWGTFPVSLGAPNTPTRRGTKVIMEKGRSICMHGPGYNECGVKFTQRLTYGGEYLHSAPWNTGNIARGVDSSNGCTNLTPAVAERLYGFLRVGDVVEYPNANGPAMSLGAGYGDWNVDWGTWQTGGLVSTTT